MKAKSLAYPIFQAILNLFQGRLKALQGDARG